MPRLRDRLFDPALPPAEPAPRSVRLDAMQTLTAGLAHEIRNPLNSAKLQLELVERRARRNGDDKLVESVERVQHEIGRLTTLVDEFLAFASPQAINVGEHDVVGLVREVLELERAVADRRGATLELVGDPTPVLAEIDAPKVRRVVDNLVANALEAVTAGGHVSVAVERVDGHVHIRVVDDGAGIPADVLPRIYEPFFSTKDGGTGMGMSIVHSFVELHQGTIAIATAAGGTTFDVALPRGG